jgi:hypothetical protein
MNDYRKDFRSVSSDVYWTAPRLFGWGVVGLVALGGLGFIANGIGLVQLKAFAPATEQVRRETFEQSKAYQQGVIQELESFQIEYIKGSPEQKSALKSIILRRVADFPETALPSSLRSFVNDLKRPQ